MTYAGHCTRCETTHRLPRSPEAERAARALMAELQAAPPTDEGKMYGVLLACDANGAQIELRAFSGRMNGGLERPGWAPPVPEVDISAEEARTFARLEVIRDELAALAADPVSIEVRRIEAEYEVRLKALNTQYQRARACQRAVRKAERELFGTPSEPAQVARRRLKAQRVAAVAALQPRWDEIAGEMRRLEQARTALSRRFQAQMRAAFRLPNPAGRTVALEEAFDGPPPVGAGECAAPKLLVEATRRGLHPLGLAEFWCGHPSNDGRKQPGVFYGPCAERCQPIMGHLLCDGGLRILYQDAHLLLVDKPTGLASVPGPTYAMQDSVQSRARLRFPRASAVHRLDVDTSGLLLLALDAPSLRRLSIAFAHREVDKRYVAVLEAAPEASEGTIELRSGPDSTALPRQRPAPDGRLGRTTYRVLEGARVEFRPHTGRTHQIRLAALHGLGRPILGDRLYGRPGDRLMLHAAGLRLRHPITGKILDLQSPLPF